MKDDRIIRGKIVYDKEIFNLISAYTPYGSIEESIKSKFWEDLNDMVQNIQMNEKLYIRDDFNGHVGVCRSGYENIHGDFCIKTMIIKGVHFKFRTLI